MCGCVRVCVCLQFSHTHGMSDRRQTCPARPRKAVFRQPASFFPPPPPFPCFPWNALKLSVMVSSTHSTAHGLHAEADHPLRCTLSTATVKKKEGKKKKETDTLSALIANSKKLLRQRDTHKRVRRKRSPVLLHHHTTRHNIARHMGGSNEPVRLPLHREQQRVVVRVIVQRVRLLCRAL